MVNLHLSNDPDSNLILKGSPDDLRPREFSVSHLVGRDGRADRRGKATDDRPDGQGGFPAILHHLRVLWMLEGDQADADQLVRAMTPQSTFWLDGPCPLVFASRSAAEWLEAHALPWDGTNARLLGVRAPKPAKDLRGSVGHSGPGPAPAVLGDRLARRRLKLVGLRHQWDGPIPEGMTCPVCGGQVTGDRYCLLCDRSGFRVEGEPAKV